MENKCFNCRFYNNGKCYNKDFRRSFNQNVIEDNFVALTESGVLAEHIKENDDKIYNLANIILENLNELEYIKKSKKKINNYRGIDSYEEFLINSTEIMDDLISSFVIPSLVNVKINYNVDSEFCCKFWE